MNPTRASLQNPLLPIATPHLIRMEFFFPLLTITLGMAGLGIAAMGFAWWHTADYFHHKGTYANGRAGYDVFTFIGLLLFTVFASAGVTLLYVGASTVLRVSNPRLSWIAFVLVAVAFIVVGCLGMVWGQETMKCLGVFCVDTTKYIEVPGSRPETGIGFLSMIGNTAFFSLVPMGLVMLLRVALRLSGFDRRRLVPTRQKLTVKRSFVFPFVASAVAIVVCWSLITFYVPNSWEYFTACRIASKGRMQVTGNYTLCRTNWSEYTCPELPWSWIFTRNWMWSDMMVLKMYPGNIFLFSYMLILLLTITMVRASCDGRKFLKRRCPLLRDFTYGEVGFALLTVLMLVLFFTYWIQGHNYHSMYNDVSDALALTERWARSFGQLAVAFLSLCIFPASRYSVLHSVLGTSWEASIWVHKVLGYGMLLATVGHMVMWYVRYAETGNFPRGIFSIPMVNPPGHVDDFTVPLISLMTWFMLLAVGVFALEPVRRRFFEVFYYMHILSFYMIAPTVLWHASAAWEYFLPGLTVWFVDRIVRMHRSASTVEVVSVAVKGSYTGLCFRHATLSAAPGQYAFVNIPELSLFEWHPMSLSNTHEGSYTLHIKSMGDRTWTGRLLELVRERGSNFTLGVDGPYGCVQEFNDYSTVLFVAGGIGITPCASIYSYLRQQRVMCGRIPAATLLWSVRDAELVTMMPHLWSEPKEAFGVGDEVLECGFRSASGEPLEDVTPLRLFLSGSSACDVVSKRGLCISIGRPNLAEEIPSAIGDTDPRSVLVFACGPIGLMKSARDVALSLGANFHEETFLL